jgi:hypothetical protein
MMKHYSMSKVYWLGILGAGTAAGLYGCHFPNTFWPLEPTNQEHPIGNSGGEFQQYSGAPYFHEGIDIVDDNPAPTGPYVRTTREGDVSLSLPGAGSLYNGLIVSHNDADNSAYKYWHLDFNSIQQSVRDAETNGTALAANSRVSQLVAWTACSYHHLHFEQCDNNGCEDPVWDMVPKNDGNSPIIVSVNFTNNGSTSTFPSGFPYTTVNGQVDIVAEAYDKQFVTATQNHKTGVMKLRYRVEQIATGSTVKTGKTINFTAIPPASATTTLYRNAAPYDSTSDYCSGERYFYVVTNVSDTNASDFQETFSWDTTLLPNGDYRVWVEAWDASGNDFGLAKQVRIAN